MHGPINIRFTKTLSHNRGWDSNPAPPWYQPRTLPLHQSRSDEVMRKERWCSVRGHRLYSTLRYMIRCFKVTDTHLNDVYIFRYVALLGGTRYFNILKKFDFSITWNKIYIDPMRIKIKYIRYNHHHHQRVFRWSCSSILWAKHMEPLPLCLHSRGFTANN